MNPDVFNQPAIDGHFGCSILPLLTGLQETGTFAYLPHP